MFDWKKPTVQMLGRWQPWHDGHQALFKRCVAKTGQVAIQVRDMSNDWDFSDAGRARQSMRMKTFADFEKSHGRYVVCDFVCPTKQTRENFDADVVIWMDTIKEGRYEDTNKLFQDPERVDFHITEWNEHNHEDVAKEILKDV